MKKYTVSSGTADLSVYFIELGLNLLKDGGQLCYITTNKFFNTGYGKKVRKLLSSCLIKELINFEQVEVFDGILVSSVILNIKKEIAPEDNNILFKQYYQLNNNGFVKQFSSEIKDYAFYPQKVLGEGEWAFANLEELALKEHIEKGHPTLGSIKGVQIFRGVTTGYNPAFIISSKQKERLLAEEPHSAEIIKKMLQGRNIRKWYYNESDEYLIFTRRGINIDNYPVVKNLLSNSYEHLKPRKDKDTTGGRKPGNYKWFEILDNTAYYMEFEKPKLIWGLTADKWAFALDLVGHYLPSNAWILTSTVVSLKYILGILNSDLMKYYFSFIGVMTAGGAFTLKGTSISSLPICMSEEPQKVEAIVDKIIQKKAINHEADVSSEENALNEIVYKLYDIDKSAQDIIKSKVNGH